MKQQLTTLIPGAIDAIKAVGIPNAKGSVSSQYHGYISSLGAGIIQAGLLPAVIFFENSDGEEKKYKITQAIYWLIEQPEKDKIDFEKSESKDLLSRHILQKHLEHDPAVLKKVTQYAIALKIALRTFQKDKK